MFERRTSWVRQRSRIRDPILVVRVPSDVGETLDDRTVRDFNPAHGTLHILALLPNEVVTVQRAANHCHTIQAYAVVQSDCSVIDATRHKTGQPSISVPYI